MSAAGLLDPDHAADYLRRRGVLGPEPVRCVALGGGVSNVVLLAETAGRRVVLKQALGRLRVAERWEAPVDRIATEARALSLAGDVLPDRAPRLIDADAAAHTLTMSAAPADWCSWKDELLAGRADPAVAERLGAALAALHNAPVQSADWLEQPAAFEALRISPYHRAVAARRPALADAIARCIAELTARSDCLVHGDFSPKNVLVGPDSFWIIDFEVAHRGDPVFDVAFLVNHLLLKAIHRPQWLERYRRCCAAFLSIYYGRSQFADRTTGPYLARQLGCLLLARALGKSPAEYLDAAGRHRAERLGTHLLRHAPAELATIWAQLEEETHG